MPGFLNSEIAWGRVNPWFLALATVVLCVANLWPRIEFADYIRDEVTQIPKFTYRHEIGWPATFVVSLEPSQVRNVFNWPNAKLDTLALFVDLLAMLVIAVSSAKLAELLFILLPRNFKYRNVEDESAPPLTKAELQAIHANDENLNSLLGVILGAVSGFLAGCAIISVARDLLIIRPGDHVLTVGFFLFSCLLLIGGPILGAVLCRRVSIRSAR